MSRRLAPEEKALWERVISTVSPLHRQNNRETETRASQPPATPPRPHLRKDAGPRRAAPAVPQIIAPKGPKPHSESLDASWDRKLASGRMEPEMTIDLHGLSRDMARSLLYRRVQDAEARGIRMILVITGKGHMPGPSPADLMEGRPTRGAIRADFPRWLGEEALSLRIAAVRRAHPRHGGTGAAYLILKRPRPQ